MAPDPKPPARIRDPLLLKQFRLEHIGEPCDVAANCAPERRSITHVPVPQSGGMTSEENLLWLTSVVCHDDIHGRPIVIATISRNG